MTNPNDGANVLGIGNGSTSDDTGDGEGVYSRTSMNECDVWGIQQASRDFATASIKVPTERFISDPNVYRYISQDNLRLNHVQAQSPDAVSGGDPGNEYWYDYRNTSDGTVSLVTDSFGGVSSWAADGDPNPNAVPVTNNPLAYSNTEAETNYGQILLYCDPQNSNP